MNGGPFNQTHTKPFLFYETSICNTLSKHVWDGFKSCSYLNSHILKEHISIHSHRPHFWNWWRGYQPKFISSEPLSQLGQEQVGIRCITVTVCTVAPVLFSPLFSLACSTQVRTYPTCCGTFLLWVMPRSETIEPLDGICVTVRSGLVKSSLECYCGNKRVFIRIRLHHTHEKAHWSIRNAVLHLFCIIVLQYSNWLL